MALKPTIYTINLALADSDRGVYDNLTLKLARHPSETLERLTARILAFGLHAAPGLGFTRGLSSTDEPDLWRHSDSGEIEHWIEVGQPEESRLRKARGRARQVSVLAFGKSADTWWLNQGDAIAQLARVEVAQLPWEGVQEAAALIDRNTALSLNIAGSVLYLDNGSEQVSLEVKPLLNVE